MLFDNLVYLALGSSTCDDEPVSRGIHAPTCIHETLLTCMHRECIRYESWPGWCVLVSRVYSLIAQLVEQMTVNHWVAGSSPARGANLGNVGEWLKPAPC